MPDPAATLRALADACDRCDHIAHTVRDDLVMLGARIVYTKKLLTS